MYIMPVTYLSQAIYCKDTEHEILNFEKGCLLSADNKYTLREGLMSRLF